MPIKPQTSLQRSAKQQIVTALVADQPLPTVPLHRTTVARLQRRFQAEPTTVLTDGRHGHPSKLRGAVRELVETLCQAERTIPSWRVQQAIQAQFQLAVSISQINRLRVQLGLTSRPARAPKKDSIATVGATMD